MARVDRIEAAMAMAEAQTGIRSETRLRVCVARDKAPAARRWTPAEDEFLRDNLGRMTEEEIARRLRRSPTAVHIHWNREMHLTSPSKDPQVLTAEHVAMGIGVDSKSVHRMIDRGILPGRRLPFTGQRVIRAVDRLAFMRWLCKPENWLYFKPAMVGAMRPRGGRGYTGVYDFAFWEEARELIQKRIKGWRDKWMTPGEIARLFKLPSKSRYVNAAIRRGTLKATRWGNWWILKSDLPKGMTLNFRGEWIRRKR